MRPVRKSLSTRLLPFHRWIGIGCAALLLLQGLTGAALLFRDSLEPSIHPALSIPPLGATVPVQRLVNTVRNANPGFGVSRVDFPERTDRAVIFTLAAQGSGGTRMVAIDPYSDQIVRQGSLIAWPLRLMQAWHEQLLAGDTGEWVVGLEGLALLFMATTGLIIWWPRGRFLTGFRILRGGKERYWRSMHRALGATMALLLGFSALTGTLMIFKGEVRTVLRLAGPVIGKPSAKVAPQPGRPLIGLDALIARTQAAIGPAPLRQLRFGDAQGRGVSVYLDATDSRRAMATSFIAYDRYAGTELGRYVAGQLPVNNALIDGLYPLHTGATGGPMMRLVLMASALSLIIMAASGLGLWIARTSRSRMRRRGGNEMSGFADMARQRKSGKP